MNKHVIIICAPIVSHILPTLSLAHHLEAQGNKVHYLVESEELKELVMKNGFEAKIINAERFGMGDDEFYIDSSQIVGVKEINFKNLINAYTNLGKYNRRKNELKLSIDSIKPDAILIDIFSATDFIAVISLDKNCKVTFISPMLTLITAKSIVAKPKISIKSIKGLLVDRIKLALKHLQLLYIFFRENVSLKYFFDYRSPIVMFRKVNQLMLAPRELELPEQLNYSNQDFYGLSLFTDRFFLNDPWYTKKLRQQLEFIQKKYKIAYCSFGTYFRDENDYVLALSFFASLIEALAETEIYLILSCDLEIIEILRTSEIDDRQVIYCKQISQLEILPKVDLFICHGGLGSIKEGIHFEIPMVIYPFDMEWDQPANGIRVKYHKIGILGNVEDSNEMIKENVLEVLNNPIYKNNIKAMNEACQFVYTNEYLSRLVYSIT